MCEPYQPTNLTSPQNSDTLRGIMSNEAPASDNRTPAKTDVIGTHTAMDDLLAELSQPLQTAEQETKPSSQWELKKLNGRHKEIMRQVLEGSTYSNIAAVMGMSAQAIMLICNSHIFKEELLKLEEARNWEVQHRADQLSNEALSTLRNLMRQSRSEVRRESAADKILGIAGYSKIEKKVIGTVDGEAVIRELNRRRRERLQADNGSDPNENPPG